jgi:hypothetical protein
MSKHSGYDALLHVSRLLENPVFLSLKEVNDAKRSGKLLDFCVTDKSIMFLIYNRLERSPFSLNCLLRPRLRFSTPILNHNHFFLFKSKGADFGE